MKIKKNVEKMSFYINFNKNQKKQKKQKFWHDFCDRLFVMLIFRHDMVLRMVRLFVAFFVICGLFVSCSSSQVSKSRPYASVQLTEAQQLSYDFDFIEGTKFKMLGDLPAAASLLTRCTEINPYDAAAHFQLSEIYSLFAGQYYDYALKHARLAVRYDPANDWYRMQLVDLYLMGNNIDSAIVVYRQIVDSQPDEVDLRYNLAFLYLENNEFRRLRKELNSMEKMYGFTQELAIARYKMHLKKNDLKSTEKVLKRAINYFPDEFRFYGLLAEMYSMIGRENDADEYYSRLLEVDPESALGYISMIEFYKDYGKDEKVIEEMTRMFDVKTIDPELKIELYIQLSSDSIFFRNNYREMDLLMKSLFEKYPDNLRVRIVNTDRNMRENNYEAARDDLFFITNRVQTNYYLWEHLFHLLYILEDYETLFELTSVALQHFDDRYLFNFFNGFSATMLKEYDAAITAYFRTLECLEKEKASDLEIELQTYVFLAEACNQQKRFAESDYAFDRALMIAPNNPIILNNYSYYLSLREEKLDLAERYIVRCIAMEPNSSTFLDTYGWVLYKLGRLDEAIAMIEKAIENGGGENPEIIDHYCELLVVTGRIDQAYGVCQYAIELNESEQTVEEKIESFNKHNKN